MTIRILLETVPHGREEDKYEMGCLEVSNIGEDMFGHYKYSVIDLTKGEEGKYDETLLHRRHRGAWILAQKVLELRKKHYPEE